jgi:hypothetical protein
VIVLEWQARAVAEMARALCWRVRRSDLARDITQDAVARLLTCRSEWSRTLAWQVTRGAIVDRQRWELKFARRRLDVAEVHRGSFALIDEVRIDRERAFASLSADERACLDASLEVGGLSRLSEERGRHPAWATRKLAKAKAKLAEVAC